MSTPNNLIETILDHHSGTLYRAALILGREARGAERLLRLLMTELVRADPANPPSEPDLLRLLFTVAQTQPPPRHTHPPRSRTDQPTLHQSLLHLPSEQRYALALYLLFGYDLAHLATILNMDAAASRATLFSAMRNLAPSAMLSLTEQNSSETCQEVRIALVDPGGRLRHTPAIRGHLATCAECRSFDQTWGALSQTIEAALRTILRERDMPARLEAQLISLGAPRQRPQIPIIFAVPPLIILVIIASLVLPGMNREPVTVINRNTREDVDVAALIETALANHARIPATSSTIWYSRYETLWYFNDATYAPIRAELWLDRSNPARHRLQISHTSGGAPYEFQIANGIDQLAYAVDPLYRPSLYANLAEHDNAESPSLINQIADPSDQARALAQRLSYGIWNIPRFYLQQAQQAADLRLLGRQRDSTHSVYILSFRGFSPIGYPSQTPGRASEPITILLSLDTESGQLRSATELSSTSDTTQSSRVTWRIIEERSFNTSEEAGSPFNLVLAWNGRGSFPAASDNPRADPAMLLFSRRDLRNPSTLLNLRWQIYLPSPLPTGSERALLIWPSSTAMPQAIIYLGQDRHIIIHFDAPLTLNPDETITTDYANIQLQASRPRRYQINLNPTLYTHPPMALDVYGFSYPEVIAILNSFQPLDPTYLLEHKKFFVE
ncbi:sigma-70 family RNA polymerase sigma factor [Candidatus Oscillochloris fontis]|uniref:sigma-70 family RNA polymerase sigma factor n=1 Tax=Candidatus Oscillochloris fontis TaxID=2496868 RepID=UPI00101C4A84|nr:sigma-70 family RNA polymerase sigma factor [Candidatus Oscillochloris fontis]